MATNKPDAAIHLCWVDGEPDDGTLPHYRPCPPDLCEAQHLHNLMVEVVQELKDRRACLTGARDDLDAIEHATVEDGGIWIRAVAQRRRELVEAAISETDKLLVALGGFDALRASPMAAPPIRLPWEYVEDDIDKKVGTARVLNAGNELVCGTKPSWARLIVSVVNRHASGWEVS